MIDQLRSIGIEKGKLFNPNLKTQTTLTDALREAHAWLADQYENSCFLRPILRAVTGAFPSPTMSSRACRPSSPTQTSILLMDAVSPTPLDFSAPSILAQGSST